MTRPDFSEENIFQVARRIQPGEPRQAYLNQACGADAALRARIEALLRAFDESQSFLESPPAEMAPACPPTLGQPAERPGLQIGPYKLLQQIGEGGMGVVYMAEQKEPVERRVALKIIKPGMDTRQVIARFEAERQALSLMDHPNIAKVLDAGTTESGRPYFVMELVKGQPITQYCDEHHLTPRQRLELLLPVCQAIQHAHQKGIIHRDIKPTNILVAEYDQKAVPKVIDFGVAKAIGSPLTEKTMFTGFGQIVGTLEYMSPEQAKVNQLDIDTRSDIYSLGVLLYELLTGSTPFDKQRLRSAAWNEMLRIIREKEPEKPSTRLSESSRHAPRADGADGTQSVPTTLASIAAVRGTEPARLTKLVRGELDWIVMKALDKDRSRRYETASSLAADLQNYLNDEPVIACPPSAAYRFAKFARRNKGGLAAASVLAVALLVAVSGIGWAVRDRSARQARVTTQVELILADVDRLMKEEKWDDALAFAKRAEAALAGGETDHATRQKVTDRVQDLQFVARLEQIRMSALTVDGKFDHAGSIRQYRETFREFGIDAEGEALPEATIRRLSAAGGIGVPVAAALDAWVETHRQLFELEKPGWQPLVKLARQIDPDPWRDRLRALWGQKVTPEAQAELQNLANSDALRHQSPGTLIVLGVTLGRVQLADLQEQILRHAQAEYPGDFWVNLELGNRLFDAKLFDEANRCSSMALAVKPSSAAAHNNLGNALQGQGQLDEAIAAYHKAIELDPKHAGAHSNLGVALKGKGLLEEAIVCCRKAIELDPKDALAHNNLGTALQDKRQLDEAIASYRKAIELDPKFAKAHNNLGTALQDKGQLDEAIASHRKAIELDPKSAAAHTNLGNALQGQGQLDEAIAAYHKAIELDPKYAKAHNNLGAALAKQGKLDEAIAAVRKAIELDPKYVAAHTNLGDLLIGQGKLDEGVACFRKAIELDSQSARALNQLAWFLATTKETKLRDPKEALTFARRAVSIDPSWGHLDTLSLAAFRCDQWQESLDARRKMVELRPARLEDKYFLAMTHWHLGNQDEARKWHAEATAEFEKAPKKPGRLTAIKQEADALLAAPSGTQADQTQKHAAAAPPP